MTYRRALFGGDGMLLPCLYFTVVRRAWLLGEGKRSKLMIGAVSIPRRPCPVRYMTEVVSCSGGADTACGLLLLQFLPEHARYCGY